MKKISLIAIVIIVIGIGLVSYSQINQDPNDADTVESVELIPESDIVPKEPKSYSVGLNEKVGVSEP